VKLILLGVMASALAGIAAGATPFAPVRFEGRPGGAWARPGCIRARAGRARAAFRLQAGRQRYVGVTAGFAFPQA
jgi:hypothetical protein